MFGALNNMKDLEGFYSLCIYRPDESGYGDNEIGYC